MKFSAPKSTTWYIAAALGVLGILSQFVTIAFVSANSFWLLAAGFVLFALATLLKGL